MLKKAMKTNEFFVLIALVVLCLIIGIVVICFGSALYMTANLGVSTYDAVAIVMSSKWKWGKFKYIRIFTCTAS